MNGINIVKITPNTDLEVKQEPSPFNSPEPSISEPSKEWLGKSIEPHSSQSPYLGEHNDSGYNSQTSPLSSYSIKSTDVTSKEAFSSSEVGNSEVLDSTQPFHTEDEAIGTGRFGTIHKVIQEDESGQIRSAALKTVRGEFSLTNEQRIMEAMPTHPNIVHYLGTVSEPDRDGLIYELLNGSELGSITNKLSDSLLPAGELFNAFKFLEHQKFKAVNHAHQNDIIHADLKPSNFLFDTGSKHVKLLDFGESARVGEKVSCCHEDYTSPEAIDSLQGKEYGVPADPAIDAYAMGQMLYKFLTGLEGEGSSFFNGSSIGDLSPNQRMEKAFRIKRAMSNYTTPLPDGTYKTALPELSSDITNDDYMKESARLNKLGNFDAIVDSVPDYHREAKALTSLINGLMHPIPKLRTTISQALESSWFKDSPVDKERALRTLSKL
ncbi:protein kinase domain-containing protein [Endozoicomonas ascidiicola]|uniref:protein kinase domain-containing protein n=1 Tax=Endozoicomonas ascidiicola TaxID=1698521 RepID=UPI0012FC9758|nr:protein kinase [Endozoicomonas ascidiicola]